MTNKILSREKLQTGKSDAAEELVLSRNPDRAMQEMMQVIDNLRAVYVEENEALLKADTSRFLALQDKKLRAARDYKAGAEQILERKKEFAKISPALRQKLLAKHEGFSAPAGAAPCAGVCSKSASRG